MISFNHVSKEYAEGTHALHDVNIQINDGEFVFVVGESGAGKSTFIKLLTKELEPTSGLIVVNDNELTKLSRKDIPYYRRKIGCVFQDFRLLDDRDVYENVAFAQRVIGASVRKIHRRVPQMLSMVGLNSKAHITPDKLSGGEQQRVSIARALINEPQFLLADEPTGNLDEHNSWEIMKLLEDINRKGTTVIVVTHDNEIVKQMHKRVITLKYGSVLSDKTYC